MSGDGLGVAIEVDPPVVLGQLGGQGDELGVLGLVPGVAALDQVEGLHGGGRAQVREAAEQVRGGLRGTDRGGAREQHVTRVEGEHHPLDGDARLRVAGGDGALDRRGAAPAREEEPWTLRAPWGHRSRSSDRRISP